MTRAINENSVLAVDLLLISTEYGHEICLVPTNDIVYWPSDSMSWKHDSSQIKKLCIDARHTVFVY